MVSSLPDESYRAWRDERPELRLPMKHQQKIHQPNDAHLREVYLTQNIVMFVICHDIACIGLNSTIHKLVVVRVNGDEIEAEGRADKKYIE